MDYVKKCCDQQDLRNAALRKGEDNGNWKRKHQIALCGDVTLEEAMDLS
jgi:hypothetical protein